jgi:hypothetical protein
MPKPARRPVGRPPSGTSGERVSEFPRITVRLPRATKDRLNALATFRRAPAWLLIDEALTAFFAGLPDAERRAVTGFVAKMPSE